MTDLEIHSPPDITIDATETHWVDVCAVDRVAPDRGVAAIVAGEPVAVFRLAATSDLPSEWFAVSHLDPFTGAPVIARGLVGSFDADDGPIPTVASPLHKQRFDLRTGGCLDGEKHLATFDIRINDDRVEVRARVHNVEMNAKQR